ncbi:AMP-binding protein [Novosphingobium sp. KCTC 2891]|uniref:non-ribosomal peptide synthetase n=1 Tax=unclassified Novosphingobium TaxID=2644732 RepID=UPI002221C4A0|nr:AMP-binding protein [Novosphingobium sp. KCTC 2891]MCW1385093.1 AMP-binding protein [Novosphingobium sp. KCTC 2891]
MHQTAILHPAYAEPPLAERLADWTEAWKRGEALGQRIARELHFTTLLDLLPSGGNKRALTGTAARGLHSLSFARLHDFLSDGAPFRDLALRPGDRCAIALPEGPELAVCLLAMSMRCTVVPMNPWNPDGEIAADLAETGAKAVIVPVGADFDHIRRSARVCGVAVIDLVRQPQETGLFDLSSGELPPTSAERWGRCFNGPDDIALELFTSGTSGRKKLVPIALRDVCVGAACIAAALELGPQDRGYNMMPLFHVGGIVRNLFAPLLAGSCMIYSDGFDAAMFWDELASGAGFTWYYASPTMHDSILIEGERRPDCARSLRFICNAAGDLLPSTAERLRARFDATILPGYGMTECMPIACPPLDYRLERRGASGRVLGPDVAILDDAGQTAPVGVAGRIMLRGAPLARIVQDQPGPGEPIIPQGWFDTGDLGRFDEDGFLYIVGRGKDVIKRGGETIAPAEIEDVLVGHPDIRAALAFAVPHAMLGETVGCVIVPRNGRRVDLETLAPHLSRHLSPAKWPVLAVYMDDLPKNATGKLLRVRLAARLGIDIVDEKAPARARLLTSQCPPRGAPLAEPIPAQVIDVSVTHIEAALRAVCPAGADVVVHIGHSCGTIRAGVAGVAGAGLAEADLRARLQTMLHDYLVPRSIALLDAFPRHAASGEIDTDQLLALLEKPQPGAVTPADAVEAFILDEWRKCLGQDRDVFLDSDFFDDLGGDSLTAVRIIADVRKQYGIALTPTAIFRHRTIRELAKAVRAAVSALAADADTAIPDAASARQEGPAAKSQSRLTTLAIQLLPLTLLAPALRLGQFVCWIFVWWYMRADLGLRGAWVMFAALAVASALRNVAGPLGAIAAKWLLIGRYRAGAAPLWGHYYLRWWLVRQIQNTAGLGVFTMSYQLTALYYRLMGARVGSETRIAVNADLGEFDLLTIGDMVCIDESAIVRPFALEGGAMDLKPIVVGANVSIGTRATIVPGTVLPADTEIAPLGTSDNPKARNQGTRGLSRALLYDPPLWLKGVGTLIKGAVMLAAWVPVVLLMHHYLAGIMVKAGHLAGPVDLLVRMFNPGRLIVSSAVLVASALVTPFLYLAGVIVVKWTVIGRFRAEADVHRPWPMFERWLMWQLLPDGRFGGVAPLLGSNFAAISVIYRLLGAKVGKRIYWPGSGNVMTEYDLFECGDDVTFGSRSTYLMTSANGTQPIRIEPGANVADRCVLAPGVVVSRNAVFGSGTFAPEGFVAPAGSTWIGQDGREAPIELEAATTRRIEAPTLRPYGRAMYQGEANYAVWPLAAHIAFNIVWAAFVALWRTAPMIAALLLTRSVLIAEGPGLRNTTDIVLLLAGFYVPLHLAFAFGALGVLVATKWLIIGRRVEGEHFWTQSSYCQRWKIHSAISSLSSGWFGTRDVLAFLEGSAFLVWYFRAEGARIGRNVCLYPNGADPMMEEPEFLHIGDGVCIDQAVLIAHLNTRGEWMMGPIEIGPRACLRTASRVMMMSTVGEGATLLEGTLVLAGDSSGPASTWEGWPGEAIGPAAQRQRAQAVAA